MRHREGEKQVSGKERSYEGRISDKVQLKRTGTPASREWLNRHFGTQLDQMSAAQIGEMGWTDGQIEELEKYIDKWNGIFITHVKLQPFKEKAEVEGREGSITETAMENGILYLTIVRKILTGNTVSIILNFLNALQNIL